MIENKQYRIKKSEVAGAKELPEVIRKNLGENVLRWYVAQVARDEYVIEATSVVGERKRVELRAERFYHPGRRVALSVIPTGIGSDIGGYAGDAAPATNLLASAVDYLITNPNAVNASDFVGLGQDNVIYTDGCCVDMFCQGQADLHMPYSNRIGLVVEKCSDRELDVVFNIVNAVRAVHGVQLTDILITDQSIGGRCVENQSGAFVGTIDNPDILLRSCESLIQRGATALAVTTNIQDLPPDSYAKHFDGKYPNPVGGVEAVISYLITSAFQVPAAHAPLLNVKQLDLKNRVVDARGAGEMASASGLACVLVGLRRAPQIRPNSNVRVKDILSLNNLIAVVSPASCLGGPPAIYAQKYNIPIVAVQENRTILDVTKSKMGLNNVIDVRNYAEAAGAILALNKGICLEALSRPLMTMRHT
jgi:hypothetical protein